MSLLPIGVSLITLGVQQSTLLTSVFFRARRFGSFVADVTVEENHTDELSITEHPVERGAAISDHSYKRPVSVVIRAGWSNSSLIALGNPNYVQQIYAAVLQLQATRETFDIITGKRQYKDMLLARIYETTNEGTENALMLTMEFKQVIITTTQTVVVPSQSVQAKPQATTAIQNTGFANLGPGNGYNPTATA